MSMKQIAICGHTVFIYDKTDSTNTRMKLLADEGVPHGSVALAREQTNGRGRMHREWLSREGAGAWFTTLTRPTGLKAEDAHGLVFVSALALARALKSLTGADIRIKWPNDIVLNGKKLAGIMCEMRSCGTMTEWAIAGIGLNLADSGFPDELPNASSVEHETGVPISSEGLLGAFLPEFDLIYDKWLGSGLKTILNEIEPLSATLGKSVKVFMDGTEIEGEATAFSEIGELIIRRCGEEIKVMAGDVSVRGASGYV